MNLNRLPPWIAALDEEDIHFIRRFVLASGSLKALGEAYGVSYPTLRGRLDRLIAKITAAEDPALQDPFLRAVQVLVADGQIGPEAARRLMKAHNESSDNKDRAT